jgi:hypothetical protein
MSELRCYTIRDILRLLQLTRSTFERLRANGDLPMLEELRPRLGGQPRYRADLVDRYLAGQWGATAFGRRRVG